MAPGVNMSPGPIIPFSTLVAALRAAMVPAPAAAVASTVDARHQTFYGVPSEMAPRRSMGRRPNDIGEAR